MKRNTLVALCAVALLSQALLFADYSIPWFTVDGGGGTSSGGGFTVSGTVGQPDAGRLTGAGFTLQGGFWYLPPGTGELRITRIARNSDGTITVEWIGGGTLLAAPSVAGPWQDVVGATSPYTFTPAEPSVFLRVRR